MNQKKAICPYCGEVTSPDEMQKLTVFDDKNIALCKSCLEVALLDFKKNYFLEDEDYTADVDTISTNELLSDVITPKELTDKLNEYVKGQEHATKSIAVAFYKHLVKNKFPQMFRDSNEINNVLIIGPTGCGKTYTAKLAAKFSGLPFTTVTASDLTAAGYKGKSVEDILVEIYNSFDGDISRIQNAVVFIDEIDKIKSNPGSSGPDVGGESVQEQLLTIIGGTSVTIELSARQTATIDTHNMLFIAAGAFSGITDFLPDDKKANPSVSIGFNTTANNNKVADVNELYLSVGTDEIIKYGFKPEFIGRFSKVVSLKTLTKDDLINILTTAKGNQLHAKINFFKAIGVNLEINEDVFETIAQKALDNKTGARGIANSLDRALENTIFEVGSDSLVSKCVLTKEMAENNDAEPVLFFEDEKEASK